MVHGEGFFLNAPVGVERASLVKRDQLRLGILTCLAASRLIIFSALCLTGLMAGGYEWMLIRISYGTD